ncbi:TPA: DNA ligase [Candidatus Dependentiae bacterium]|nr:MAG: putative DNA ligase [candidate division TM6 bacterium GW2011_GWE2_31_21]KKP53768.1 MAG: putative DNA ligase [candidate division TM6 bacterium GW2011_GWF2_33_332]HBS48478.1 DNA ligase [Candidatus Dependentiae bacterium]HBZ73093.1 DNA ligase [Candidatus Dependentiae bacterium]
MKFKFVTESFEQIEKESSRTSITKMIAELLKKSSPQEAAIISYLALGELRPSYQGTQFHVAEKSLINVIAAALNKSVATVKTYLKKIGDLGLVFVEFGFSGQHQENLFEDSHKKDLSVLEVYEKLNSVLDISGTGSQDKKENEILHLLKILDPISAKYILRIIVGKLRLGFSDMTLLDAFSWMESGDKSLRVKLEDAYNVSADIGLIIKTLKEDGIKGIEKMKIIPGVPIRPAAAERLANAKAIFAKLGPCVAQPKFDGFRLQVHKFKHKGKVEVRFFSRNLQDMSHMFPELTEAVKNMQIDSFVAEGEAISFDVETGTFLPFQETVKRRRKYEVEKFSQDFPLKLFLFDLLYFEGESILNKEYKYRRAELKNLISKVSKDAHAIIELTEEKKMDSAQEMEQFFHENISDGLEGIVVKKLDAIYQPGKRNFNWVKLKREEAGHLEDTIDCVILGYNAGHGKRAHFGLGAFLVGVFNPKKDIFQTVAKIGTGLSDQEWKDLKKKCDEFEVANKPKNVDCKKELYPDIWVSPEIVCAIRADEITISPIHTAGSVEAIKTHEGFALRFPRIMGYRPDKSATDATTVEELKHLFDIQFKSEKKNKKK